MGAGFYRLMVASGLSNLADGVFQVALPIVTLGITRDPGAFSLVMLSLRLPWLLWALPAGALADRLDRRRTMFLVNLGRVIVIGGLALAIGASQESVWLLSLVAFALGIGETMYDTAAQSIVPNLVDDQELSKANGRLFSVEMIMNQFVGPPLGGLIAAATAAGALSMSSGAYLLAALALLLIRGSFRPVRDGPPTRLHHDIAEGVRYVWGQPVLRTMALLTGISNMAHTAMVTVLPIYAVDPGPMGLPKSALGFLLGAGAVGALFGSLIAPAVERWLGRARSLSIGMAVFAITTALPGVSANWALAAAGMVIGGVTAVVWNVITVSLRQRITPDQLRGRMNSVYRLLAWGSMPFGAFFGGQLGELFGVRSVFLITAAATLLAVPYLVRVVTEPAIAAAESRSGRRGDGSPLSALPEGVR